MGVTIKPKEKLIWRRLKVEEQETTRKKSDAQVEKEIKKIEAFLKAVIPEHWDTYDYKSKYDSTLTYVENKNRITEDIKKLYSNDYKGATLKEQAEYAKAQQERLLEEQKQKVVAEVERYNKSIAFVESKELDAYFEPVDRALIKLCKGYSHLVFVKGRGGVGKSRRIRHILTKHKEAFYEVTGDVTEAYLYRLFYENNGKTIWFKDVTRLLRGLNSIILLKAACETEDKRLLTKCSYSKQQDDLPDMFIWKGKIVFDYNEVGPLQLKEDFEALITRGDYIQLAFSEKDIHAMMRQIAQKNWQKEVTEFLIKQYEGTEVLNLRHQWKAFQTYNYAKKEGKDWKAEVEHEIHSSISDTYAKLYTLTGGLAIRAAELKRLLLQNQIVGSLTTANRRINDWLAMGELHRWSTEKINFIVSIRQPPQSIAEISEKSQ